jgi:hypothetical protein
VATIDLSWAKNDNLQSSYDSNVFPPTRDEFGRPVYVRERPNPAFQAISVRDDLSRSRYLAATIGVSKRFSRGYQLQAHYTLSRDEDNDSNERSATSITVTDFTDPDYDYGLAERDVRHRFVFSGVVELPLDFKLSAIATAQSGSVYSAFDPDTGITNHPTATLSAYAVIDGQAAERNSFRGPALRNVDLRLVKFFDLGETTRIELIAEAFNVFNVGNFIVGGATTNYYQSDGVTPNPEFGLAGTRARGASFGFQRQFQLGARVSF